ncbi:DUF4153 domain-containing protein [Dyadobacter sp. NIV53]|uniref:DUF4153 domain-containing protein n=1 Tax=Dyadobacter sp. NIV53 TaxID=2861765 RepID=UPI001C86C18A|nr:DUF4153 domain-containing protein [Dyadobacter sp. NIV53]
MSRFRTSLLWITLTSLHTWLFYNQSLGFNGLIFSVIMVILITWHHGLQSKRMWRFGAGIHLITAIAVFWHGTPMSIILYNFSGFALAGFVFMLQSSLLVVFLNGLAGSFAIGFFVRLAAFFSSLKANSSLLPFLSGFTLKRAYLYVAPATVTAIFYFFYCIANPDFFLDLSFPETKIDFDLILYAVFGSIILCPLIFPWGFKKITEWDLKNPDILKRIRVKREGINKMGLMHENFQGVIMFFMLNILILFFICFNTLQIFIPSLTKYQSNHSEQVHQGFDMLIMSIVAAILLIMYYFRENQNFYSRKTRLVKLATAWIVLNSFLAMLTCYKNILYVGAFGFTYKRIWVFIGLILIGIGLYLTLMKIRHLRTNWYLIRQNTWILYFTLTSYSLVDWDRFITWYNPNYAQELDFRYIADLGKTKLPYLKELAEMDGSRVESYKVEINSMVKAIDFPVQTWQSQTLDNQWLKGKLIEP